MDLALRGGAVAVLDDSAQRALLVAPDPPVAGGVVQDGGRQRGGCVLGQMPIEQLAERLLADQRAIAAQHQDVVIVLQLLAADHYGVPGAELGTLLDPGDVTVVGRRPR